MSDEAPEVPAGRSLLVGLPGPDLDRESARRLAALSPAGVILFRRNLDTPARLSELVGELRRVLSHPLLLGIDQEGGRVSRLAPWIGETPSGERLARSGPATIAAFASATARALRSLGFNLDFAPVVDLCGPDAANGIGDRSFGTQADEVALAAGAFLDALQRSGVAGCLKHFPGLGPTAADTHAVLPTVALDRAAIEEHLRPFRLLAPRAAAVMISHAHFSALDPERDRPASQSAPVVEGLLRGELGFRGLVVADDMEMGAVAPGDTRGAAAPRAMAAGCDLLPYCASLDRAEAAAEALEAARSTAPQLRERMAAAARAIARVAERWPAPTPSREGFDVALREIRGAVADA